VPVIKISMKRIDEYNLGQLMYFFELACAISGYILEINPFDQPGVESYKRNMFALLGKKGFEEERDRLEKELKEKG
jgi:glucose-6-phosphate isomerase